MKLEERIKESEDMIRYFGWMAHDKGTEELILENQIEIMKALIEIQSELSKVKKSYTDFELGPP